MEAVRKAAGKIGDGPQVVPVPRPPGAAAPGAAAPGQAAAAGNAQASIDASDLKEGSATLKEAAGAVTRRPLGSAVGWLWDQ